MITTDNNSRLVLVLIGRSCPGLTLSEAGVLRDDVIQSLMLGLVFPQIDLLYEDLPAVAAGVRPLARVKPLVYFFILFQRETSPTERTIPGFLSGVNHRVTSQLGLFLEAPSTLRTFEGTVLRERGIKIV